MNCLAGQELAEFEEHLLVCEPCQDRLACEDSIRQRVRDGAAVLQRQRVAVLWRTPKLAWALGLAAAGLAIFAASAQFLRRSSAPPAVILLQATRGTQTTLAAAPAAAPLALILDLTGLRQFSEYKLEIVDAGGRPAFQSNGSPRNNRLQAALPRGLAPGVYFVRVYAPAGELLREYALTVHP